MRNALLVLALCAPLLPAGAGAADRDLPGVTAPLREGVDHCVPAAPTVSRTAFIPTACCGRATRCGEVLANSEIPGRHRAAPRT